MRKKFWMKYFVGSFKNSFRCVAMVVMMGWLVACGEDPQQLFETAQFEEQQHNEGHAQELYERILRDHPESAAARQAEERLKQLKKGHP